MKCENCFKEHDGGYGSGRFCCKECARCFSTKNKRNQINEIVSNKLKGRINLHAKGFINDDQRRAASEAWIKKSKEIKDWKLSNIPFDDLNKPHKKMKLLIEQQYKCAICNMINEWNNKPLIFQLDHVNGNHNDNNKLNLRMICPNCHSQTETFTSKNVSSDGLNKIKEATIKMQIKYGKKANQSSKNILSLYNASIS